MQDKTRIENLMDQGNEIPTPILPDQPLPGVEPKKDLCEECDAVEKTDTEGKPAIIHNNDCPKIKRAAAKLPPWLVFRPGEEIPLKGFRFKVVGYSKGKFELILACVGQTGKAAKKAGRR